MCGWTSRCVTIFRSALRRMFGAPRGGATYNRKIKKKKDCEKNQEAKVEKTTSQILREVRKRSDNKGCPIRRAKYKKNLSTDRARNRSENRDDIYTRTVGTVLKDIEELEKQDKLRKAHQKLRKEKLRRVEQEPPGELPCCNDSIH